MTLATQVIDFYKNFRAPNDFPPNVHVHNPWQDSARREAISLFCEKYYNDENARTHLIGINPSRLTGTSTGINYTDGYALSTYCGIPNEFSQGRELTSEFFYSVVEAMGGATSFYASIFAWALMPLSVTTEGKYKNYYDPDVRDALQGIVDQNFDWLSSVPSRKKAVVLGKGHNAERFTILNENVRTYDEVLILPHPRWIMQYNRDSVDRYVEEYVRALS